MPTSQPDPRLVRQRRLAPHALVSAALLAAALGAGCARGQAFYDRGLVLLEENRAIELGKRAEPLFVASYGGELPSPQVGQYVSALGQRLAARSYRPALPWAFHVVDSDVVNAFALPGGEVFVTRGLLAVLTSEAELAGILAHEVAHVAAGHVGQQVTRRIAMQLATSDVEVISRQQDERWLEALGVSTTETAYALEFSREQELQADAVAVRALVDVDLSPRGQEQAVTLLLDQSSRNSLPPAWLSTHPYPALRRAEVAKDVAHHAAREAGALPLGAESYQAQVLSALEALPPARHHAPSAAPPPEESEGDESPPAEP